MRCGVMLLAARVLAASAGPAPAQPPTPTVVESSLIPSGDPGIQLYVRSLSRMAFGMTTGGWYATRHP